MPSHSQRVFNLAKRGNLLAVLLWGIAMPVAALSPPSVPEVDAPQLAALGKSAVGVRTLHLVHLAQPDVLSVDVKTGVVPIHDRPIDVDLFYPAIASRAAAVTYRDSMSAEPPLPPAVFTVPGIAPKSFARQRRPFSVTT